MPETLPGFQRTQYAFAAHIRDPDRNPAPSDVRPERMAMYRELFLNNVESFISSGFPVLRGILDDRQWHALIQDFFAAHRCITPYFMGVPEEFLNYLRDERESHPDDLPFLLELAHYEWVELALFVDEGIPPTVDLTLADSVLARPLALSALAWPLVYRYPVHRINPSYLPKEPPPDPTFLAVYRDGDDRVRFMELNPVSYRLLQLIENDGDGTGLDHLHTLAQELGHSDADVIVGHGQPVLAELARRGIIYGTGPINDQP